MKYLSLYFLMKVGLYFTGYIGFNWMLNLALAVVGLWPIAHSRWKMLRAFLVWPAAAALLYHDSYLPNLERMWARASAIRQFSGEYVMELLGREVTPHLLWSLLAVWLAFAILSRWVRFSTFAVTAILSVPLAAYVGFGASAKAVATVAATDATKPTGLIGARAASGFNADQELKTFYATERQRHLAFPKGSGTPPFDVIVLHVCSLSWDDLDFANERNSAFLGRFDVLFSNFNGATTYSGPSVTRVLRGNCGQSPHNQLYQGADPQCFTFPSLAQAGYQVKGLLNHNGVFDSFARVVEREGGMDGKLENNKNAPAQMQSFDGSPIYDDYALLSNWWTQRQAKGAAPVALYYNTITLHDGARMPGVKSQRSIDTYKPRLTKLFSDFDRFISELESAGRPVVVVLLPEHGASLRWRKGQIDGMREIPDPKITLLPAAIKLVGMKTPAAATILVDQPVSYFGLYSLLGDMMSNSPYSADARPWAERLQNLVTTPFVAENEDVVVMRDPAGTYVIKSADGTWLPFAQ